MSESGMIFTTFVIVFLGFRVEKKGYGSPTAPIFLYPVETCTLFE